MIPDEIADRTDCVLGLRSKEIERILTRGCYYCFSDADGLRKTESGNFLIHHKCGSIIQLEEIAEWQSGIYKIDFILSSARECQEPGKGIRLQ